MGAESAQGATGHSVLDQIGGSPVSTDAATLARRSAGVVIALLLCAAAAWFWGQALSEATVEGTARSSERPAGERTSASGGTVEDGQDATPTRTVPLKTDGGSDALGGARGTVGADTTSGPGIDEPGVTLSAAPTSTGTLEVAERVRTAKEVGSIVLSPPRVADAGPQFDAARPVLEDVQLTVAGQPVVLPTNTVTQRVVVTLPTPARSYELRYRLEGTSMRSVPSTAGRALAALAPASRTANTGAAPVVVRTSGDGIRNLSCPLLKGDDTTCAAGQAGALTTRFYLAAADALVVLQLDLPRP